MFDKLKQINELRKMQNEFKKEKMTVERQGVKVTMNGSFEVEEVVLNSEMSPQDQQGIVKDVMNQVREDIQKNLAQKMMGSGMMNGLM